MEPSPAHVVIQYQAGAGGAQAWSQLNSMDGDGYTIMGINLPHTVLQPMAGDVGYKTEDLTPVYYFHYTPDAIFVPKDSQFETLEQLLDYAKENPGIVTFAGSGSNSANNLAQSGSTSLPMSRRPMFRSPAPARRSPRSSAARPRRGSTTRPRRQSGR